MRLVLLSGLMLFLELPLIRLIAGQVVYVRFFTNFVLIASFLGIGLGFLRAKSSRDLFSMLPLALLVTVAFVLAFPVEQPPERRTDSGVCPRCPTGWSCRSSSCSSRS